MNFTRRGRGVTRIESADRNRTAPLRSFGARELQAREQSLRCDSAGFTDGNREHGFGRKHQDQQTQNGPDQGFNQR